MNAIKETMQSLYLGRAKAQRLDRHVAQLAVYPAVVKANGADMFEATPLERVRKFSRAADISSTGRHWHAALARTLEPAGKMFVRHNDRGR